MKIHEKLLSKENQKRAFFLKTGALFGSLGLFLVINDEFNLQKRLNKEFIKELNDIYGSFWTQDINLDATRARISKFKDVWANELDRAMSIIEEEYNK